MSRWISVFAILLLFGNTAVAMTSTVVLSVEGMT
jgi:hypothetical protein